MAEVIARMADATGRMGDNGGMTPPRRPQPKRPSRRERAQKTPPPPAHLHQEDGERLQKVLAAAGFGSRRGCEQLILDGRVTVDGHIVRELGIRIEPRKQTIHVDGFPVSTDESAVYLAFNKPAGVVTAMEDPDGRPTLADYLTDRHERLFHVGRLDQETEGLLLVTNDGDLTHRLTHPSWEVPKIYLAEIRGPVARDVGPRLKAGIELEDGLAKVDDFKLVDSTPGYALVQITLHSGRNRIVRRLLEEVGHPVLRLVRTDFGPIRLGEQRQGTLRTLNRTEVGELMKAVGI